MIVKKSKIKNLNEFYKNNFEKHTDYNQFLIQMGSLKEILEMSVSAEAEFRKQFERRMALQPAILSECFVAQTIANIFELDQFIDADEKKENIPSHLFTSLIRAKGGELESTIPRYIYFSDKNNMVLLQYGDSSSIDAIFVKDGYRVRLEIKEEKAKLGEYDLNYDEGGELIPTNNIIENHSDYLSIIKEFNNETSVFESIGSNFKIGRFLNYEIIERIVSRVFNLSLIDLYILQNGDKIFAVPSNQLLGCVDIIKGSEIRTAGRNSYKVFTPNKLNELIDSMGGQIINNIVTLPLNEENFTIGRGMQTITRYKLNNLFYVKYSDIIINDKEVSFNINNVRQIKSSISLHLYSKINRESLLESYNELNKK